MNVVAGHEATPNMYDDNCCLASTLDLMTAILYEKGANNMTMVSPIRLLLPARGHRKDKVGQ